MTVSVGIAVAHDSVRLVVLRAGSIIAAKEAGVSSELSVEEAIARLAAELPLSRFRRRFSVCVAVGPSRAQTRRVRGLPPLKDPDDLSLVVKEGVHRFFLRSSVPLITSRVEVSANGDVWAAAFEEPTIMEIERGCRRARLRLRAVTPTVAVLAAAVEEQSIVWKDGPVSAEVLLIGSRLTTVRRKGSGSAPGKEPGEGPPIRLTAALAKLGARAFRFADAYGAASLPPGARLVLPPGAGARAPGKMPRGRWRISAVAMAFATLIVLAGPGLASLYQARAATARLEAVADERREAALADAELHRINTLLSELSSFVNSRRSATLLLGELARVIPDQTAIVSLRTETGGGSIVALTSTASSLVSALEQISIITGAEISGPITQAHTEHHEARRVTVEFAWADDAPSAMQRQGEEAR